jgi:hypothetical protein
MSGLILVLFTFHVNNIVGHKDGRAPDITKSQTNYRNQPKSLFLKRTRFILLGSAVSTALCICLLP